VVFIRNLGFQKQCLESSWLHRVGVFGKLFKFPSSGVIVPVHLGPLKRRTFWAI